MRIKELSYLTKVRDANYRNLEFFNHVHPTYEQYLVLYKNIDDIQKMTENRISSIVDEQRAIKEKRRRIIKEQSLPAKQSHSEPSAVTRQNSSERKRSRVHQCIQRGAKGIFDFTKRFFGYVGDEGPVQK